jgi:esterase/lipase superfamily enzyme
MGGQRQSWGRLVALFAGVAMLCGCTTYNNPYYVHSVWRPADASDKQADVFYLTDRKPNPYWLPDKFDRAPGGASCGVMRVEVPPARLPAGEARFARETERNAITCGKALSGFAASIAQTAHARGCGRVLVYVHGFNTGFETSVLRAAQLGSDTQWNCAVAAFSWNSMGDRTRYAEDRARAAAAEPLFAEFLRALENAHLRTSIIAHSMGTQLVLKALASGGAGADQVIFAAPDIGLEDFAKLAQAAAPRFRHLTIYVSAEDIALAVSPRLNNGITRLGHGVNGIGDARNTDVIDASDAPSDLAGHGYFGLSYEMQADMMLALAGETAERRLQAHGSQPPTLERAGDGTYRLAVTWMRRPGAITRFLRWLAASIAG